MPRRPSWRKVQWRRLDDTTYCSPSAKEYIRSPHVSLAYRAYRQCPGRKVATSRATKSTLGYATRRPQVTCLACKSCTHPAKSNRNRNHRWPLFQHQQIIRKTANYVSKVLLHMKSRRNNSEYICCLASGRKIRQLRGGPRPSSAARLADL